MHKSQIKNLTVAVFLCSLYALIAIGVVDASKTRQSSSKVGNIKNAGAYSFLSAPSIGENAQRQQSYRVSVVNHSGNGTAYQN